MKVLHIISGGDSGGAKTHMFALLDKQIHKADVTVMCLMQGVFYKELITDKKEVKSVLFEQKNRFDLSVNRNIADYINREGFDIVNCHGARANFVAKNIKNKISVPIVTTVHSDPLLDFDSLYKKLVFQNLNVSALKKIDYKIAVSDSFKDMLISRGAKPNSVETVYNGMDFETPINPVPAADFAKKYGIPVEDGTIYFGIAARFNRVKGVDIFIKAAAELYKKHKNVYFIIAGDGEDEAALKSLAEKEGIAGRIKFTGFVSPIYDFLNFIDVNLLTSLSESFPYSMLEGAKARKPMVASRVGGIPKLVREGKTGFLFESENYKECAEKMAKFVSDPGLVMTMGDAIYDLASENFSNEKLASDYISIYEKTVEKYKKAGRYDIVLSGYYGFGNFGDELMLSKLVASLKNTGRQLSLLAVSGNRKFTERSVGIDSVGRLNIPKIKKNLSGAKVFINGGGNILQNATSKRSLSYYLFLNKLAKSGGAKTAVIANGIGPIEGEGDINRTVAVLKQTDLITVRDDATLSFLEEHGITPEGKTPDLAFLPEISTGDDFGYLIPKKRYFVVSIRPWSGHDASIVKSVSAACDRICEKYGMECVIVPFQKAKDTEICERTAAAMKHKPTVFYPTNKYIKLKEVCALLSGAEFVLGMRLHSLIYSYSKGVPCVGIAYDPKVTQFMEENGLRAIFSDGINVENLESAMDELAGGKGVPREAVEKRAAEAQKNIDLILSLL